MRLVASLAFLVATPAACLAQTAEIARYARAIERTADSIMLLTARANPEAIEIAHVSPDTLGAKRIALGMIGLPQRLVKLAEDFDAITAPRELERAHLKLRPPIATSIDYTARMLKVALVCSTPDGACLDAKMREGGKGLDFLVARSDYLEARNRLAAMVRATGVAMPDRPKTWLSQPATTSKKGKS